MNPETIQQTKLAACGKTVINLERDEVGDYWVMTFEGGAELCFRSMAELEAADTASGETYPCIDCGKLRTVAQGGRTFTVCDECWDKRHPAPAARGREGIAQTIAREWAKAFYLDKEPLNEEQMVAFVEKVLATAAAGEQAGEGSDVINFPQPLVGRTLRCVSPERLAQLKQAEQRLAAAERERDAAKKFKAWVHKWLDDEGVPTDPDPEHTKQTGCRISGRMKWFKDNAALAPRQAQENPREIMRQAVERIQKLGYRILIMGCACGFDLDDTNFARTVDGKEIIV